MIIKSKTIRYEPIGDVLLEASRRAKHISISIRSNGKIRVAVPLGIPFSTAEEFIKSKLSWIQHKLLILSSSKESKTILAPVDKRLARKILEKRVEELSKLHDFKYNKLTIRNQKTRWGSCSSLNNLSLNARLLHLPSKLIDYVILHELVHTQIKNHSKIFWQFLDKYVGNSKHCSESLKKYIII